MSDNACNKFILYIKFRTRLFLSYPYHIHYSYPTPPYHINPKDNLRNSHWSESNPRSISQQQIEDKEHTRLSNKPTSHISHLWQIDLILKNETDPITETVMSQAQTSEKLSLINTEKITEIIEKHSKVSTALDDIHSQLSLIISSQTCYHIITELMKNNANIQLIDDVKNANDINEETDNLVLAMNETEIRTLLTTLNDSLVPLHSANNKNNSEFYTDNNEASEALVEFELNWDRICNCIGHEMWPKLASSIRGIVNEQKNEIKSEDFSEESIEKIIEILKGKRNLAIEERIYLKALTERAKAFKATKESAPTHECMSIFTLRKHRKQIFYLLHRRCYAKA